MTGSSGGTVPPPEGLAEVRGLPPAQSISLTARARDGADQQAVQVALWVLHATLGTRRTD